MADNLLYELSVTDEKFAEVFINREVVTAYDSQNGVYSTSSILLDLSSIANQTRFTSFKEGTIDMPIVLSIRDTTAGGTAANANIDTLDYYQVIGLKNSFNHLIHSMTLKINNTEVVSQTELSSVPHVFRLLTELSQEEQEKMGSSFGFFKDNSNSWAYSNSAIMSNNGLANVNAGVFQNEGLVRRLEKLSVVAPSEGIENGLREAGNIVSNDNFYQQFGIGAWDAVNATTTALRARAFYGIISIKLADLHDVFNQLPLMKGAYLSMTLIVNQCSVDFTYNSATKELYDNLTVNVPSSGVCPIMLNNLPFDANGEFNRDTALTDGNTYKVALGIGRSFDPALTNSLPSHPIFNTIQVRVPQYDFNPAFSKLYVDSGDEKEIRYIDYQRPTIQTISAGAQINTQFSTGIARLRSVLVCPFVASTSNDGIIAYQSPLGSEPASCSPYCHLGGYNININGRPIYPADMKNYGYQHFLEEISPLGVNGNLTRGLTSGLISQDDWENNFGYYYTNTARRMPEVYDSATSVSLQCSNRTKLNLDLQAFLAYERRMILNVQSGQVKSFV
jgi:hypothetical protein